MTAAAAGYAGSRPGIVVTVEGGVQVAVAVALCGAEIGQLHPSGLHQPAEGTEHIRLAFGIDLDHGVVNPPGDPADGDRTDRAAFVNDRYIRSEGFLGQLGRQQTQPYAAKNVGAVFAVFVGNRTGEFHRSVQFEQFFAICC